MTNLRLRKVTSLTRGRQQNKTRHSYFQCEQRTEGPEILRGDVPPQKCEAFGVGPAAIV